MGKTYGVRPKQKTTTTTKSLMMSLVKKYDNGQGADEDVVLNEASKKIKYADGERAIQELVTAGDLYYKRPGLLVLN